VNEEAFLLHETGASPMADRLARLVQFFGVAPRRGTVDEWIATAASAPDGANRLLGTAAQVLDLLQRLAGHARGSELWAKKIQSVFLVAGEGPALAVLLERLAPGAGLGVARPDQDQRAPWIVSNSEPALCASMAGARLPSGAGDPAAGITGGNASPEVTRLITGGKQAAAFVRIMHQGVPVLIATAATVVDVEEPVPVRGFDLRERWAEALPAVLYVRWAFPQSAWKAPGPSACLVIDDPLLKPRYGFVDFQGLLAAMRRHRFSTSIAFIPWNWRRSRTKVVRLFQENPDQLSISVHGCDHTAAEFGGTDPARLRQRLETALTRMDGHAAGTGLRHDAVMVFPQGVFSTAALAALKQTSFMAAVNTEVTSVDPPQRPLRIADVWDVAIMGYSGFPIFTRRYPWQGLENFAFDVLLGKPCLIVIHHDFCRDRNAHLIRFMDHLNARLPGLAWRRLADVLRRSYRLRSRGPGQAEVEMYATELHLENPGPGPARFAVRRRETEPAAVQEVLAGETAVPWQTAEGHLRFQIELNAGETRFIQVRYRRSGTGPAATGPATASTPGFKSRLKIAARRYLSEFRDDYVARFRPGPAGMRELP
jgi:hypothetical protein